MRTKRKQRLFIALGVIAAAALITFFLWQFLGANQSYLRTPSEVVERSFDLSKGFRLGGVVLEDSVSRKDGSLEVTFVVSDRLHEVPVRYEGILPDLFQEGQSVITEGKMQGDVFHAKVVMAKHDETYMPKEVADKMAEAHVRGAEQKAAKAAEAAKKAARTPPKTPAPQPPADAATDKPTTP